MVQTFLMAGLILASFAAVAPAAVVYGGYSYGGPVVRAGVYAAARYYSRSRVYTARYVDPEYPAYATPYYGYGYRYGYAPRYYGRYRVDYYRGYRR